MSERGEPRQRVLVVAAYPALRAGLLALLASDPSLEPIAADNVELGDDDGDQLSLFRPLALALGMKMTSIPSLSASAMRWSIRFTARISPDKPISPTRHIFDGNALSS